MRAFMRQSGAKNNDHMLTINPSYRTIIEEPNTSSKTSRLNLAERGLRAHLMHDRVDKY